MRKRIHPYTFVCIECNKEEKYRPHSINKFCSHACQAKWRWQNETKPRLESGGGSKGDSRTLKRYLVEKCGEVCSECLTTNIWNGKPLTLHVDHIDGNSDNVEISNLRLLCPNCHSQTLHGVLKEMAIGTRRKQVGDNHNGRKDYWQVE